MVEVRFIPPGLGWQRDLPDPRDYTPQHPQVRALMDRLPLPEGRLPSRVDLRRDDEGFTLLPPEDQGAVNASSAFACLTLMEYFERKTLGRTLEASPLFLYQMACKLERISGNGPIGIRTVFKALLRFGVPPEDLWPYANHHLGIESCDVSLLGYSSDTRGIIYLRPTHGCGSQDSDVLDCVKRCLAAGFPIAFGIPVPRGLTLCPDIPYRPHFESYRGGQAMVAIGYDDSHRGACCGAVMVRSSWGPGWGEDGYGYLPYAYLKTGLAADFWTIIHPRWIESRELCRPT